MNRYSSGSPTWIDYGLRVLTVVIGVAVVALSLGPPPDSEGVMSDKLAHFLSYFSFTYCALLGFMGRPGRPPVAVVLAYALVGMVAAGGAGIELLQFLIGRDTSLMDALANAAGASLGLVVWILTVRRTPQQA
ncbi:MAG: hypothetical protein ACRDJ0_13670 [Actinomycetota bacterium]